MVGINATSGTMASVVPHQHARHHLLCVRVDTTTLRSSVVEPLLCMHLFCVQLRGEIRPGGPEVQIYPFKKKDMVHSKGINGKQSLKSA